MTVAANILSRQTVMAVAVFVALLLGTVLWGTSFLFINQGLRDEFNQKTQIFDQLRKQPPVRIGGNATQLDAQSLTISASTETLAASELQRSVLRSLDTAGGSVRSIQAESAANVAEDGLRRLSAQVTFDGSLGALQEFLFAIETAMPYIFVDSMLVQPSSNPAVGADRLRVTLVASSYWKPERSGASQK